MFIESCQVLNYKSFKETGEIRFSPGFNIVVGKNNAGKTALLEALSLRFGSKLHRSLTTSPKGNSLLRLRVAFGPDEVFKFLRQIGKFFLPGRQNTFAKTIISEYEKVLREGLKADCEFQANQIQRASFLDFLDVRDPVNFVVEVNPDKNQILPYNGSHGGLNRIQDCAVGMCNQLHGHTYIFRAERLNVSSSQINLNPELAPNAENLASVLHLLQSKNKQRFERLIQDIRIVFPDVKDVTVIPSDGNRVNIHIWFVDPSTEREDLAVPLEDCGTGIGQVLAMLYVVITSVESRILLIDEPQSFLHPGAVQKLFAILKREKHQHHQFIVTTHSPNVITAASPCTVLLLRCENNETKPEIINISETKELRLFLSEVGARLSDVFGADRILWVEGRTEELCFPRIIKHLLKLELLGTEIIGVTSVGELGSKHKRLVFEIYKKLCQGKGLLPPALGFCFDQEALSDEERAELTKESNNLMQFIPRRMFENYLLNPKAVVSVVNECDTGRKSPLAEQEVADWIAAEGSSINFIVATKKDKWPENVNAAKLLKEMFNELTETRVSFDKIRHGEMLTDWILEHSPTDFSELVEFLQGMLLKSKY